MIRAKRSAFWNAHQREIERMPLYQIERLRIAPKRDRNILRRPPKPSLWRLPHLLFNIFQIHFAHKKYVMEKNGNLARAPANVRLRRFVAARPSALNHRRASKTSRGSHRPWQPTSRLGSHASRDL